MVNMYISYTYRIDLRTYINAWVQINAGVQHSKVNKCLHKPQNGLKQMSDQKSFIGNKHPGFYTDKYSIHMYTYTLLIFIGEKLCN